MNIYGHLFATNIGNKLELRKQTLRKCIKEVGNRGFRVIMVQVNAMLRPCALMLTLMMVVFLLVRVKVNG